LCIKSVQKIKKKRREGRGYQVVIFMLFKLKTIKSDSQILARVWLIWSNIHFGLTCWCKAEKKGEGRDGLALWWFKNLCQFWACFGKFRKVFTQLKARLDAWYKPIIIVYILFCFIFFWFYWYRPKWWWIRLRLRTRNSSKAQTAKV